MSDVTAAENCKPDGMLAYALAIQNPDENDPNWPLPSFDARDWAKLLLKLHIKRDFAILMKDG